MATNSSTTKQAVRFNFFFFHYLIDSFLEDGALIRLDGQRVHVSEAGRYQLGQLFNVDVLLFSSTFFIKALVTGRRR